MRDAGMLDGDWVAVHKTKEIRDGQIVVARIGALPSDQETKLCRSPSFDNRDFRAGPSFGSRL